jgi:GAF domain-containing protein
MALSSTPSVASVSAQWLVSNAGVTVGPVHTELLLRGVMHGKVPSSSWVKQTDWQCWREVGKIREVCALTRVIERTLDAVDSEPTFADSCNAVTLASDAGEALLIALRGAARATSATVGLAHRLREPLLLPTTSCVFEASSESLGQVLPWHDPAFALARCGGLALGVADGGPVERALSSRLSEGRQLRGVAMVPITIAGRLCAVLELGRSDHPFRDSDAAALKSFARHVAARLSRLERTRELRS